MTSVRTLVRRYAREFTGYNLLESAKRLVDRRPLQCSLFVTDRCNLDCAYCTEYDNREPHPPQADVKDWMRSVRDLGTMRIALVGGEPLTRPDIAELVAWARDLGFATSLTTNGFLLTRELVRDLEAAGLQVMQVSVDRMIPRPGIPKSFKTVLPKLALLAESRIAVHVTGVLCADTLEEAREVLATGLELGYPTEVRLVHADPTGTFRVEPGDREALAALLEEMVRRKRRGERIHTSEAILSYQLSGLRGEPVDWTCAAGYKLFFVSARGKFWVCSQVHTDKHIRDVTLADLHANDRRKSCQEGCGVYCAVSTSLLVERPFRVIGREVVARARRLPLVVGEARSPRPSAT